MTERYILDDEGQAIPCPNPTEWAKWFEKANRTVEKTSVGDSIVSTIFLGLNHAFGGPVPILWETLIFGGARDGDGERYSSRDAAIEGHRRFVAELQA